MPEVIQGLFGDQARLLKRQDDEQVLAIDAALGDVARLLCLIRTGQTDRNILHQLCARLLHLRPLVELTPGGEPALDAVFEAARQLVYAQAHGSSLRADQQQGLGAAYLRFRAYVAVGGATISPVAATG